MTPVYIAFGVYVFVSIGVFAVLYVLVFHAWRTVERQEERHERRVAELTDQLMHAMGHTWRIPPPEPVPPSESDLIGEVYMDIGPELTDG